MYKIARIAKDVRVLSGRNPKRIAPSTSSRNAEALAAEPESRITPQDQAEWTKGTIEDRVMEGHRLAQTVEYRDLGSQNPAEITPRL